MTTAMTAAEVAAVATVAISGEVGLGGLTIEIAIVPASPEPKCTSLWMMMTTIPCPLKTSPQRSWTNGKPEQSYSPGQFDA